MAASNADIGSNGVADFSVSNAARTVVASVWFKCFDCAVRNTLIASEIFGYWLRIPMKITSSSAGT